MRSDLRDPPLGGNVLIFAERDLDRGVARNPSNEHHLRRNVKQRVLRVVAREHDDRLAGADDLAWLGSLRCHDPRDLGAKFGVAQTILRHLSLLFVPAGVGVMAHAARIESEWIAILVALLVSAVLTIAVTALVFRWVARWVGAGGEEEAP